MASTILNNRQEKVKLNQQNLVENSFSIGKIFTKKTSTKIKFQFLIHICMLFLCIMATIAVLTEERLIVKITLGFFMGFYVVFVVKNKVYQQMIMEGVYQHQYQQKYRKTHTLQLPKYANTTTKLQDHDKDRYKLKQDIKYNSQSLEMSSLKKSSTTPLNLLHKSINGLNPNLAQKSNIDQSSPLQVVRSMSRSVIGSFKNVVDQMKNTVQKINQNSQSPTNLKQLKRGSNITSSLMIQKDKQKGNQNQERGFDLLQGLKRNIWKKKEPIQSSSSSIHKIKCLPRTFLAVNSFDQNQRKQYSKNFIASLQSQNILKEYNQIWAKFKNGLLLQLKSLLKNSQKNWQALVSTVQRYYEVKIIRENQRNHKSNSEQVSGPLRFRQCQVFNDKLSFNSFCLFVKQKNIQIKDTNQKGLAEQYLTKLFIQREQIDTLLNIYSSNFQIRQKKLKLVEQIPSLIDQKVQPMIETAENLSLHSQAKVLCLMIFVNKINTISDAYQIKMRESITNKFFSFLQTSNIQVICEKGADNITPHYNLQFRKKLIHCEYGVNNPLSVLALMFYKIWQEIYNKGDYKGSFDKKQQMKNFINNFYSPPQF